MMWLLRKLIRLFQESKETYMSKSWANEALRQGRFKDHHDPFST